jgi:hypothetical protein
MRAFDDPTHQTWRDSWLVCYAVLASFVLVPLTIGAITWLLFGLEAACWTVFGACVLASALMPRS